MKITKFGHCCLLIEERGLRILTDPGTYTKQQNHVTDIDVVLISHEHGDHFHVDSVKEIIKNNPNTKIITNSAVAKLLTAQGIESIVVGDGEVHQVGEVLFSGHGTKHAIVYKEMGQVENTAYFIGPRLYYPGDAFYDPKKPVEILALPVAGPWVKISEAIDYALTIGPKIAFPVHDGGLVSPDGVSWALKPVFQEEEIQLVTLEIDKETEL